jgi:diguanylate cyclase (GGDEF)-like protein
MNKKATILVVDDTKENIHILLSLLQDYDLLVALDGQKALQMAEKNDIDIILLDIVMPDMDGYAVCNIFKSKPHTRDIPILFITAKTDEESIEKAYDVGGIDYVTKPFKPKELLARVKTQLENQRLIRELEFLASRDSMTGIYNRRKFFELGTKLFNMVNNNFFAIMIDIDKFKNINDNYGHPFGDVVIKSVSKNILNHLAPDTIFARLGGEEFAILCEADIIDEVQNKIEQIREKIENLEEKFEGKIVKFTISNGIAQKYSDDTLDSLLKRADEALYEAKGTGRNKVCFR